MLLEQWILFYLGIILVLSGIYLMGYGILVRRKSIDFEGASKLVSEINKLIDTIAKHVPNGRVGLGLFMVIVGIFFILLAFLIPVIPGIFNANTTSKM